MCISLCSALKQCLYFKKIYILYLLNICFLFQGLSSYHRGLWTFADTICHWAAIGNLKGKSHKIISDHFGNLISFSFSVLFTWTKRKLFPTTELPLVTGFFVGLVLIFDFELRSEEVVGVELCPFCCSLQNQKYQISIKSILIHFQNKIGHLAKLACTYTGCLNVPPNLTATFWQANLEYRRRFYHSFS